MNNLIEEISLRKVLFSDMHEAVIAADVNRKIVKLNKAAEDLFGYSETELIGQSSEVLYASPEDFQATGRDRFNKDVSVDKGITLTPLHVQFRRKDGSVFDSQTIGTALQDDDNVIKGFICIIRDISESFAMDKALKALYAITTNQALNRNQKIDSILEMGSTQFGLDNAIVSRALNGVYQLQHAVAPEMTVAVGDEMMLEDTYCNQVFRSERPIAYHKVAESQIRLEPCYKALGLEAYIGAPLVVNGQVYGVICFCSHKERATPFSQTDIQLIQLFAQWVSQEIASALHLSALESARQDANELRQRAESANTAKSMFLANMSHEIRTPMNAVLGMSQLLARSEITEKQRDYVTAINSSGRALLRLIDDVLDLSMIEAGRVSLNYESYDLVELGRDCLDAVRGAAEAKGLELKLELQSSVSQTAIGDVTRISQVIINLLGNAIKFTPERNVTLRLSDTQSTIRIEVEDSGPGVSEADRKRIFDRFVQSNDQNTREHDGAGLGLSIVSELVALHQGQAGVSTAPAGGAIFWVELPRFGPLSEPEIDTSASLPQTTRNSCCNKTVLLVEDDVVNRAILEETIQQMGWTLRKCADGEQALEALRKDRSIDLLMTDLHMPRLSGLETLKIMRAEGLIDPQTPVVFITADVTSETKASIEAQKAQYLTKPLDLDNLQNVLERVTC